MEMVNQPTQTTTQQTTQVNQPVQQTTQPQVTNPAQATNPDQTNPANTPQTNPSTPTFDVNNLPPEFVRYLDQQRTQASQTARANTRRELMRDEEFLNQVRGTLQPQVQKTVEEQMQDQMRTMSERLAASEVRQILISGGIGADQVDSYIKLFANQDIEESMQRATDFVSAFQNTLQAQLTQQQAQALVNMTTPQAQANAMTDKDTLQAQLNEARKDRSYMREVRISAIMREASEKGIQLI